MRRPEDDGPQHGDEGDCQGALWRPSSHSIVASPSACVEAATGQLTNGAFVLEQPATSVPSNLTSTTTAVNARPGSASVKEISGRVRPITAPPWEVSDEVVPHRKGGPDKFDGDIIENWLSLSRLPFRQSPTGRRSSALRYIDEAVARWAENSRADLTDVDRAADINIPTLEHNYAQLYEIADAINYWRRTKSDPSNRDRVVDRLGAHVNKLLTMVINRLIDRQATHGFITGGGALTQEQRREAAPWETQPKRWWVADRYSPERSPLKRYLEGVDDPNARNITLKIHARRGAPMFSPAWREGEVGHAWVEFELPTGEREPLGFWPQDGARGDDLSFLAVITGVRGAVIRDLTEPMQTFQTRINAEELARTLEHIKLNRGAEYRLFQYNCVTFARSVYNIATGKSFPGRWTDNPTWLADDIAAANLNQALTWHESSYSKPDEDGEKACVSIAVVDRMPGAAGERPCRCDPRRR